MLPSNLRLRNFLSYGDDSAQLDFTRLHIACLSGDNGAGKSALFDAITWALWGEARGTRASDELIHRGADYMEVELGFDVGGDNYRVLRSFDNSRRKGNNNVYLHRVVEGDLVLVAEKKHSVDNALKDLLRIEHSTFVASSYLRQGDADYFSNSNKLAKRERKELFIDLLDLGRFEIPAARSKAKQDTVAKKIEQLENELGLCRDDASQLPEAEATLLKLESDQDKVDVEYEEARRSVSELQQKFDNLKSKSVAYKKIADNLKQLRAELEKNALELSAANKRTESYQQAVAAEEETTQLYNEFVRIREELSEIAELAGLKHKYEEEKRKLADAEDKRRNVVKDKINELNAKIQGYSSKIDIHKETVSDENSVKQGCIRLTEVKSKLDKAREKINQKQNFEKTLQKVKSDIEIAKNKLDEGISSKKTQLDKLEEIIGTKELTEKTISDANEGLIKVQQWLEDTATAKDRAGRLDGEIERLKSDIDEASKLLALLTDNRRLVDIGEVAICPVCARDFDEESRTSATKHIAREIDNAETKLKSLRTGLSNKSDDQRQAKDELDKYLAKDAQTAIAGRNENIGRLESKRDEIKKAEADVVKLRSEIETLTVKLSDIDANSPNAKQIGLLTTEIEGYANIDDEIANLEKRYAELAHFPTNLTQIEKDKIELKKVTAIYDELKSQTEELKVKLQGEFLSDEEKERLIKIEERLASLGYSKKKHENIRRKAAELDDAENAYKTLQQAQSELKLLEKDIAYKTATQNELTQNLELASTEHSELEQELAEFTGIEGDLQTAKDNRNIVDSRRRKIAQQIGGVRENVSRFEKAKEQLSVLESKVGELSGDLKAFEYLTKAFGRDGIPTLMLERGLVELELIANDLLAALTRRRIQVSIRTEAMLKSGKGSRGVFDVIVSDNGIERKYNLFSGGERFRVDFALRVALSQLLSQRSGAPLEFLIIDEGFGTQDAEGLSALVSAIDEVSDRFKLVLVISHLHWLRDQFPATVEVTKSSGGLSSFEIV